MVNSTNGSNPHSASSADLNLAQQQYTNVNNPVPNANHSHRHTVGPKGRRPSLLRNDSSSNSVYTPSNTAGDGSTPMHSSHLKWSSSGTGNNNASSTTINESHNSTNANTTSLLTPSSNKRQTSHNNSGNNTLSSTGGRARSRSITQTLSHNLQNNNKQYLSQEKAYLKKMKNQFVDDYYTKGITGAEMKEVNNNDEDDDEDEDETNPNGHSDLLADMDDDKYQIDYNLAFTLLKNGKNAININPNRNITQLNADSADDPAVIERLEWQSMLTSVLTGDVVRSEKTKIINNNSPENEQSSFLHATYKENLWFGIHAKLFNRTEDDQRKIIEYRRTLADALFDEVLNFEVNHDDPENNSPRNQVAYILDKYDKSCDLWRTLEDMKNEKPVCRTAEFQDRIDALTAWLSITDAMQRESDSLKVWIGNDEMDTTKSRSECGSAPSSEATTPTSTKKIFNEDNKSLAERLMKEKDVYSIFQKRIFFPLAPWMIKSKDTYLRLGHIFETLKLPDYIHDLIQLCLIPMKLIKEIINVRLVYAKKLENPTLMMIDQMIDDFKSYITIALEVKLGIVEYCRPDVGQIWVLSDLFDSENQEFDKVVLKCVKYFFALLNKKLLDSSRSPTNFRTFKEPEELEETWNYLKWLGNLIDGGSVVVAEHITVLTLKLIHRLLAYFNNQIGTPPAKSAGSSDLIRWYSSTTENFGQLRRKLARFTGEISRDFTNSLVFDLSSTPSNRTKNILEVLKSTNHFLVYTGTVETQGTYFFASAELMGNEQEILRIINGSYIGSDPNEANLDFSDLLKMLQLHEDGETDQHPDLVDHLIPNESSDFGYVLALCPPKPIVWEGHIVTIHLENVPITDIKVGQILMITKLPYGSLHMVKEKFLDTVNDFILVGGMMKQVEQRCSLAKVHHELTKINRVFFKMSLSVLDSVKKVRANCKELAAESSCQELINSYFIYARDFGKNSVKNLDSSRKSTVIMKLIQLSIEWVSFVCDDCIPTDRRTFRSCVLALEFAMDMTRGFNVLVLNDEQFYKLKLKVARCMSLLISHFDIMGARSSEAEKKKLLKWSSQRHRIENSADDACIIQAYREDVMREIEEIENYRKDLQEQLLSIGRVLDVTDLEYQFVTLLASSFSSVSIRWQKGRFIGGGTFGHVYAAVNLDTGGVMAVKEIRFHDSQSVKNIVPSIKDEMTILEMLNHPNVVQYFGVEVHRHKVYIFMEFCEGGSLAGLLTHGRIEDEMVIQVYTLQMLEGLAYLHQSGVAHRDIKPENILLDHNGVIKFVDFGAAKVIATSGRTLGGGSGGANQGRSMNGTNLNSMTGTPMYMSPEVITGASGAGNGVVDIWSLGCCVLEMATGRRPWTNLDNEWAIMYHIAAGHKPQLPSADQLSDPGRKFISRCLEHDPSNRPGAVELLNDPWIVAIRQAAFVSSDSVSTPSSEVGSDM